MEKNEKKKIKKSKFLEKYYKTSLKKLAQEFSCSVGTIYRTLKKYDIPLKGNSMRDFSYLKNERKSRKIEIE